MFCLVSRESELEVREKKKKTVKEKQASGVGKGVTLLDICIPLQGWQRQAPPVPPVFQNQPLIQRFSNSAAQVTREL